MSELGRKYTGKESPTERARADLRTRGLVETTFLTLPQKFTFLFSACICGGIIAILISVNALIVFCGYAAYFKSGDLIRNCHKRGIYESEINNEHIG